MTDGVALQVGNLPPQVGDFAYGWGQGVVDDDQVVIRVEGQLVRVEGAGCLGGSEDELLGQQPRSREERRELEALAEEIAACEYVHQSIMSPRA